MTSKYCFATANGSILPGTIQVGWNENNPNFVSSKFQLKVGSQAQPLTIHVVDRRLALKVYAWKQAALQLNVQYPIISVTLRADILGKGDATVLFASEINWGTPMRDMRILAEKLYDSMIAGDFKDYSGFETLRIEVE